MEEVEDGRVASDRALVSDQAASRLAPSGFDPSRICALLERAETAINDWVATYASDMCSEDSVRRAWDRIGEGGGTLCYTSSLVDDLRSARLSLSKDIKES